MPFGIDSAPEVFQRKMHELIEGLTGIEVIADDFLIVRLKLMNAKMKQCVTTTRTYSVFSHSTKNVASYSTSQSSR